MAGLENPLEAARHRKNPPRKSTGALSGVDQNLDSRNRRKEPKPAERSAFEKS